MSRRTRIGLIVAAAVLIGLPVMSMLGMLVVGNTDSGRRMFERTVARLTHDQVVLQGLSGRFPDRLHLKTVELSDPQGSWLQAEDVTLDTVPLALIGKGARIDLLRAARLSVSRRPDYGPSPDTADKDSGRSWINDVQLGQLDLQRLELGAPLTGTPSVFRVQGDARLHAADDIEVALSAQRLDTVAGTYEAHAHIDSTHVDATLELQEGPGGPLTQLARVPELGALSLHVRLQGPRDAVRTRLDLGAGPLVANVAGSLNFDRRVADLNVDAHSAAIAPLFGVAWREFSLHGTLRGTTSAPDADMKLQITGLTAPGAEGRNIEATVRSQADKLMLDASIKGLSLQSPQLVIPESKPVSLHAQTSLADKAEPVDFTLTSSLLNAQGHLSAADMTGTVNAQSADLKPVMALGGLDLEGRGTLQAKFDLRAHPGRLDTHAELEVTGGAAPVAALLRPRATAVATVLLRPDGLEIKDTRVTSDHLQLALDGTSLDSGMKFNYKASLPQLAVLSPQMRGHLSASGSIRGKSPALDLDADVDGELAAHGAPSGPLHLVLHAHDVPARSNGSLELHGKLDGAPIDLVANAATTPDGGVAARIERGDWKSAHIEGAVRSNEARHTSGRIDFRMAQLTDLDRLLGQPLQGSLQAGVVLDDKRVADRAQITVVATDIGLPSQLVHDMQLHGQIDRPLTKPTLSLQLTANGALNERAAHLTAQAHGPLENLALTSRINLDAVEDGEGPVDAAAQFDAAAILDVPRSRLQLTTLNADYRKSNLRLLAPAIIDYGAEISVDQLRLKSGDAQMQLAGKLSPMLSLHGEISHVTSAQLQALSPGLAIEGQVDATADLSGDPAHPTGHVEMHAVGLRAGAGSARNLPASNIDLKVDLANTLARVDLQARAGAGMDFMLNGQVPLNQQTPMQLKANGAFDINLLNPILEAQGQHAQGTVRIDARVTGTPKAPQAQGTLVLAGVDVQDYAHGARLTGIQATVAADGETLNLQQFTAKAGSGNVTANGTIKLGASNWPVDLKISGRDAQLLASDLLTANLDFDASLSGALRTQLTTGGTVHVNRAVINIPGALPPDIQTLHMIRPGQHATPAGDAGGPVVALDYHVEALHAVFVRGRGIDSEFGGKIHVQGTTDKIAITGGFEMVKGSIALGGTTLQFDHGSRMAFNGTGIGHKIDPTLDFSASNNTGTSTTATLKVTGYADAPVLTLSSVPDMPQDQILSLLLFGTSNVSSLSALQLASIGSALVTLGGVGGGGGGGFNPINTVQKKLGLDRLSVGGGGSGSSGSTQQGTPAGGESTAATVEAGRYVSSRVYVGAKESTAGSTQAEVQVDLTQRLKLQATLATGGGTVQGATPQNDPGSSAGIAYQLEY
jgi:translocation and assembly module TamB